MIELNEQEKHALKAISETVPIPFSECRDVYLNVNSYDKTITIINAASESGLSVYSICETLKVTEAKMKQKLDKKRIAFDNDLHKAFIPIIRLCNKYKIKHINELLKNIKVFDDFDDIYTNKIMGYRIRYKYFDLFKNNKMEISKKQAKEWLKNDKCLCDTDSLMIDAISKLLVDFVDHLFDKWNSEGIHFE